MSEEWPIDGATQHGILGEGPAEMKLTTSYLNQSYLLGYNYIYSQRSQKYKYFFFMESWPAE